LGGWRRVSVTKYRKRLDWAEQIRILLEDYPHAEVVVLILDNFSPHRKKEVRKYCRRNNIHMIWMLTNASWFNPIECHFIPIKEFVIRNSKLQKPYRANFSFESLCAIPK
jgi:transposase